MPFVLDASVTAAWLLADEPSDFADRCQDSLISDIAIVPTIWPMEIRNILLVAERRQRTTPAATDAALKYLAAHPIALDRDRSDDVRLLTLARTYGLSAYDAAYLELAERTGLPLATQDRRLANAANAAGVPLLK